MWHPESTNSSAEIEVSTVLRDKVWEHMPLQARTAQQPVTVTYWTDPLAETKLTLHYNPSEDPAAPVFVVTTDEILHTVYLSDTEIHQDIRHRIVELSSTTGEIGAYAEIFDRRDARDDIVADEADIELPEDDKSEAVADALHALEEELRHTFAKEQEDFLVGLFETI